MGEKNKAEPASNIQNRLRSLRLANGLTQAELAAKAGITRQAVYAIEANQYLPTTAVALRLADALDRRVEDLFSLVAIGEAIEGDLIGSPPTGAPDSSRVRSEEHTSELQSRLHLLCRLLLEKKKPNQLELHH